MSNAQSFADSRSAENLEGSIVRSKQDSLRVLFVEDNDNVRELSVCILQSDSREVVALASGEAALDSFYSDPFDVVITDVSLPGMSGIELTKKLLKVAPHLWVVIASGYQLPLGLDKLGVNVRAITKPFESEQIEALLSEVVASRNAT